MVCFISEVVVVWALSFKAHCSFAQRLQYPLQHPEESRFYWVFEQRSKDMENLGQNSLSLHI